MEATALFVASDKAQYNFCFPTMQSMVIKRNVYLELGGCPEDLGRLKIPCFSGACLNPKSDMPLPRTLSTTGKWITVGAI